MYFWTLALLGASALLAADEGRLALVMRSQTDFDRVELAAEPPLRDSVQCVQSQAALLPVVSAEEAALVHYRKGYCTLAGALVTRTVGEFADASREFEKSLETWPAARPRGATKDKPPDPVSAGLRVLASISRLEAGLDRAAVDRERGALAEALGDPNCPAGVMPVDFCQAVLGAGRRWLGWIALDRDNLPEAARDFAGDGAEPWSAWVAGRLAAQAGRYADAAAAYRKALESWTTSRPAPASLVDRLIPEPDLAPAYSDLGSARIQAGDPAAAIASFDEVVKRTPSDARAIYLRGRAKELAGRGEPALADYGLASRTAFANARNLASGEAHLYRGVLLYRRKDFERAEAEFASALNFAIPAPLQADAEAWRHLAAVAGGACGSRPFLERSLVAASADFPKDEARAAMASCSALTSAEAAGRGPAQ
jgi:tetratricopeptide (TPR) repeat protein